ncbi:hypothetical protein V6N12_007499 [Hibiscus sabdariffa]|uniref:Uncharacterized protein n=1 Tax=Hibiscus sabdariffa TaxID=183260 RepID=A0ABR2F1Y7_9ROSI
MVIPFAGGRRLHQQIQQRICQAIVASFKALIVVPDETEPSERKMGLRRTYCWSRRVGKLIEDEGNGDNMKRVGARDLKRRKREFFFSFFVCRDRNEENGGFFL